MKDRIRNICDLCLGLLILTVTVLAYFGHWDNLGEYCFVSGMTAGIIFISSFIYRQKSGRSFGEHIYICCSVCTMMIFIATIALGLNLNGAFIFIHIIDPLLMFFYWAFLCEHNSRKRSIPAVLIFPVCYTLLSGAILAATGDCPFPASLVLTGHSPAFTALLIAAVYALFLVLGCLYHFGSRLSSRILKAASSQG